MVVPSGSGSLGACKREKQLVWLTQRGKALIHRLGMIMSGGRELKDLVGPCSSSFLPHCGLEGSQSPSYLLSFRKGFFCQSFCTAARELFEVKINLYFMWLLLFLSQPFVSFCLLLQVEAYLIQTGLLLALQTDLSSELTNSTLAVVYTGEKKQKVVIFNVFFISTKWLQKLADVDTLCRIPFPSIPSFNRSQTPAEHLLLPKRHF